MCEDAVHSHPFHYRPRLRRVAHFAEPVTPKNHPSIKKVPSHIQFCSNKGDEHAPKERPLSSPHPPSPTPSRCGQHSVEIITLDERIRGQIQYTNVECVSSLFFFYSSMRLLQCFSPYIRFPLGVLFCVHKY